MNNTFVFSRKDRCLMSFESWEEAKRFVIDEAIAENRSEEDYVFIEGKEVKFKFHRQITGLSVIFKT